MVTIKRTGAVVGMLIFLTFSAVSVKATPEEDGLKGIEEYEAGNLIEGMALLRDSAEAGFAPAQARLGYILDQAEEDEAAVYWLRRAAKSGNAEGQYRLGKMYSTGEGVQKKDLDAARRWIFEAANQGHPDALRTYAAALERGDFGLARDEAESVVWLKRAARSGDSVSAARLARAYREGMLGLDVDVEAARKWEGVAKGGKP